ncbi:phenylacetone monooxygenase [Pleomassaria siparia CBS 279.74]|uniref:Phenylacetone monooxygenase n=1 Tax=Pleomassaria siparia CBS 279.74 TaxID=1314801 RepID=A0A6G1KK42_9PLEO|nr:phenylacetone monooxygenase [Pleomassaria siparia CBS 279.74]
MTRTQLKQSSEPSQPLSTSTYNITEKPLGTPQNVRIILVGAGASGINMLRALRLHLTPGSWTATAYEKNPRVGGTWYENRYPGCHCDIPAHNYQFAWRPNPGWSEFFAPAPEIEEYLEKAWSEEESQTEAAVLRTECQVVGAIWEEQNALWNVTVHDLKTGEIFTDRAQFLLDATGILNNWHWPDIPGRTDFKGEMVHSANWPNDFSSAGKTVAVIGNGSSGIQIVPAILPEVKSLVHFIRSPTWVAPPSLQTMAMGKAGKIMSEVELTAEGNFTPAQIEKFKSDPVLYRTFVKGVEDEVNGRFPIMLKDSPLQRFVFEKMSEYMTHELGGDERLCGALIPKFPVGCRRLTPGTGYLKALTAPKTRLITEGIARIIPEGVELVSGEKVTLDTIVCATGFDVSFRPRFPLVGREGNLQDIWAKQLPRAYMSCAVSGFPNYFMFLGPNAPIGHGSVFTITEHIAKYIVRVIKKIQTEGITAVAPSPEAVAEFAEHIDTFMPRTAWQGSCRSWFKGGSKDGPVTALHPGSRIHFFHMLETFRGEDWLYTYKKGVKANRFVYLGNGFSSKELDGSDTTWYLDEPDKLYL